MSNFRGVDNSSQLQVKRCAIYSPSSVEKDNRDPFDSVSAQFMACAEFIGSQVGKGWRLVDTIYEDRGYSGSHMRRAGFQQFMAELNAHDVPVVSVTQQIDMSHHVGRLATNFLALKLEGVEKVKKTLLEHGNSIQKIEALTWKNKCHWLQGKDL
jgi:DNA invertase Pin-like site-specific DNA recombinase